MDTPAAGEDVVVAPVAEAAPAPAEAAPEAAEAAPAAAEAAPAAAEAAPAAAEAAPEAAETAPAAAETAPAAAEATPVPGPCENSDSGTAADAAAAEAKDSEARPSTADAPQGKPAAAPPAPIKEPSATAAKRRPAQRAKDFEFGAQLGEGAFAKVLHARHKRTKQDLAVKILMKSFIIKEGKQALVMMERKVQSRIRHPLLLSVVYSFQDTANLYVFTEICKGGQMLRVIQHFRDIARSEGRVDEAVPLPVARFLAAEIVLALEYLHLKARVVHRDLKPENILMRLNGHICITDFGTAKDMTLPEDKQNAFCGTAEYVSPEVLRDEPAGPPVDLWALGCIVFQMVVGRPPFRGGSEYLTFQQILSFPSGYEIPFPEGMDPDAKDLVESLIRSDGDSRLGAKADGSGLSYETLKAHAFFKGIDWDTLADSDAPFKPSVLPQLGPDEFMVDGADPGWEVKASDPALHYELASSSGYGDSPAGAGGGGGGASTRSESVASDSTSTPVPTRADSMPRDSPMSLKGSSGELYRRESVDSTGGVSSVDKTTKRWGKLLAEDEQAIYASMVDKRKGLFTRRRELVLTDKPRLVYFHHTSVELKGEIPLSEGTSVIIRDPKSFDVVTPKRTYHLSDLEGNSTTWKRNIMAMLRLLTPTIDRTVSAPASTLRRG